MKKGIIIYALGHSNYYRMAEVLAASLIANQAKEDGIAIGIVCDDEAKLTYPDLFDDVILLQEEKFMEKGLVVFNNATMLIYDLSPYDVTIKLDADMIWMHERRTSAIFKALEGCDITFENRGHGWNKGNSVWAEESDLKEVYKLTGDEKLYKIFGEFIYFKKTADNKKFFKTAKDVYNKRKVKSASFSNGVFTDELAFQVACMLTGIYPHQDNFTPIYNGFLGYKNLNRKYPYQLEGFEGYSIGGNMTDAFAKENYNNLAKHYFAVLGLSGPYQVIDKRSFLPERKML